MSDPIDDKIPATDLLDRPLTSGEKEIARVHLLLERIYQDADLPPCVEKNLFAALGLTWQVMNDLGIPVGMPEDLKHEEAF